jgi:hypothetical protein
VDKADSQYIRFCTAIVAVQNILGWLAYFVHNEPPSPKFQILPSQLRQTADRAAGLYIKSLGWACLHYGIEMVVVVIE